MVLSYFRELRSDLKVEVSITQAERRVFTASVLKDLFTLQPVFERVGCNFQFCPCQEVRPSITEEGITRVSQNGELDELPRNPVHEKTSLSLK